jgi:hypothetical protein
MKVPQPLGEIIHHHSILKHSSSYNLASGQLRAEEKKTQVSYNGSSKGVHFEGDSLAISKAIPVDTSRSLQQVPSLRSRRNKKLQLNIIGDDDQSDHNIREDIQGITLPKTSSYFISSSVSRDENMNDGTQNVSKLSEKTDYNSFNLIPPLQGKGLLLWDNLARQLRLPIHVVRAAVKSKFNMTFN